MQDVSTSHPIAGVFTPRLVARLQREAFDGTLRFHAGAATRVIYFRRGDIASAASNAEDDRLHNILIREGRLTGPQVDMARSRLRPGTTLGKTLIDLGFLTPSELLQGARRQVRQILAACFSLTDGDYQIAAGPLGPEVTNLGLPARRLIFDALMESGDRQAVVAEMGSMESIYRPSEELAEALAAMRLDAPVEEVARRLDGKATLREISGRTHLDDFTVSKIVLALDIMGLAEMASPPGPPEEAPAGAPVAARAGRRIPIQTDAAAGETPVSILAPLDRGAVVPDATRFAESAAAATGLPVGAPVAAVELPVARADTETHGPVESSPLVRVEEAPAPERPGIETTPSEGRAEVRESGDDFGPAETAEPPPFRSDELPAFAAPEAEPEGWSIDPETGERVHRGPVELTFDGTVAPMRVRGSSAGRRMAIVAVAAVVVIAVAMAVYLRRAPSATGAPAQDTAEAPAGAPMPSTTPSRRATTPESSAPPESAAPPGSAPSQESAPPQESARTPETAPPREPAPPPEPTQVDRTTPAPATVPGEPEASDLSSGQTLLDAGEVDRAAGTFSRMIAAAPAGSLTLQVLIACEAENVLKARTATRPDGPLFIVPFRLQDRSCWRVCWGRYRDRQEAGAAAAALPAYFTTAGVTPVVVSFARLHPPS